MSPIDEIFKITVSIDNSTGTMSVTYRDNETEVENKLDYVLDLEYGTPDMFDNIAEFLIDSAKDALIEGKKRARYSTGFSKEIIQGS